MTTLITLHLDGERKTLEAIRDIPGLQALRIDEAYGLVAISPKRNLYVIRVEGTAPQSLVESVDEVVGVHGDVKITTHESSDQSPQQSGDTKVDVKDPTDNCQEKEP